MRYLWLFRWSIDLKRLQIYETLHRYILKQPSYHKTVHPRQHVSEWDVLLHVSHRCLYVNPAGRTERRGFFGWLHKRMTWTNFLTPHEVIVVLKKSYCLINIQRGMLPCRSTTTIWHPWRYSDIQHWIKWRHNCPESLVPVRLLSQFVKRRPMTCWLFFKRTHHDSETWPLTRKHSSERMWRCGLLFPIESIPVYNIFILHCCQSNFEHLQHSHRDLSSQILPKGHHCQPTEHRR